MKIALVTETFPPEVNGVAMTFGVIARELGRRGHGVTVYRPRRDDLPAGESHPEYVEVALPGVPIPRYPLLRLGLPAGGKFRRAWRAERPDVVHVATEGPMGASAVSAARAMGIPVASSFHTNFHAYTRHYGFSLLHSVVLGWLRHVHNRTERTFAPTLELCGELADLGFSNVGLLTRGVDVRLFHPSRRDHALRREWGAGPEDPIVLHVGRMALEKNYDLLFRAFAEMGKANPRCRFVLAGDGPLRARLQREHPEYVFMGFASRTEIARQYASADIYIHASLTETFGNVLTEAMASGLAVAAFDYAAGRQFVQHGKSGLLAPCDRPEALVEAALLLATDDLLRAQMRPAARASVEKQSWESVIARFERDLAEIAGVHLAASEPALA